MSPSKEYIIQKIFIDAQSISLQPFFPIKEKTDRIIRSVMCSNISVLILRLKSGHHVKVISSCPEKSRYNIYFCHLYTPLTLMHFPSFVNSTIFFGRTLRTTDSVNSSFQILFTYKITQALTACKLFLHISL